MLVFYEGKAVSINPFCDAAVEKNAVTVAAHETATLTFHWLLCDSEADGQ
jgi:hypothetical protein